MDIELTEKGLIAIAGLLSTATAAFVTALITGNNANKRQEIQAGIDQEAQKERAATEKTAREEQAAIDQEAREAEAYRSRVREALAPVTHFADLTTGFVAQIFTMSSLDEESVSTLKNLWPNVVTASLRADANLMDNANRTGCGEWSEWSDPYRLPLPTPTAQTIGAGSDRTSIVVTTTLPALAGVHYQLDMLMSTTSVFTLGIL